MLLERCTGALSLRYSRMKLYNYHATPHISFRVLTDHYAVLSSIGVEVCSDRTHHYTLLLALKTSLRTSSRRTAGAYVMNLLQLGSLPCGAFAILLGLMGPKAVAVIPVRPSHFIRIPVTRVHLSMLYTIRNFEATIDTIHRQAL